VSYVLITPARNEADNLPRLARSIDAQEVLPLRWLIVDTGSTDETIRVASELMPERPWMRLQHAEKEAGIVRGGPIVRAFNAGVASLDLIPDVVVKLDADVSFERDYFKRLLEAFADDPALAIVSGSAFELDGGRWTQRHMTDAHVWGASRAYRWTCLEKLLPLDEQMGWDGLDVLRAHMHGWNTRTLTDLPFRHHRKEGQRDGARWRAWAAQGRASHYMGYRFGYLVARAIFQSLREPGAMAMIYGFLAAALRRRPQCDDADVRRYLRSRQRVRDLPRRLSEASGRRSFQPR
jgi:poly-beta-1,6-N-acetyl-D-glucosamine synthase